MGIKQGSFLLVEDMAVDLAPLITKFLADTGIFVPWMQKNLEMITLFYIPKPFLYFCYYESW